MQCTELRYLRPESACDVPAGVEHGGLGDTALPLPHVAVAAPPSRKTRRKRPQSLVVVKLVVLVLVLFPFPSEDKAENLFYIY